MIVKKVKAEKPYDVVISDSYKGLGDRISALSPDKICIVCDENTRIYLDLVEEELSSYTLFTYEIKAGEKSKTVKSWSEILSFLARNGFSRSDMIIALGGGVVGDLAGFVASAYMRGVTFVNLPTSILADVDSSVGGKTAVDIDEGKNLVGAFYSPALCFINVKTLDTLPEKEITCGMGEIVKYAFLSENVKREDIENKRFEKLISDCLDVKIAIVGEDEKESGKRKLLNLGHTFGHAIENLSLYTIPHGECVAKGLKPIIRISQSFYGFPDGKADELYDLLNCWDFDLENPYGIEDMTKKIKLDKKSSGDFVDMVLIEDIGKVNIEKIKIAEIEKYLK